MPLPKIKDGFTIVEVLVGDDEYQLIKMIEHIRKLSSDNIEEVMRRIQ
jgi:hypothetical protein